MSATQLPAREEFSALVLQIFQRQKIAKKMENVRRKQTKKPLVGGSERYTILTNVLDKCLI